MVTPFRPPLVPLFVPGDRPDRFAKAAASGADAVILDLEDGVAPDRKDMARRAVAAHGLRGATVIVRVNAATTPWFGDDLAALAAAGIAAIMLPKAETAAEVAEVRRRLGRALPVLPLIETARGLAGLAALLPVPGIAVAALGHLDLAVDLGCAPSWDALLLARSTLVLQSRLAGLPPPIDGVTPALDDEATAEADARAAAALGFGGKLAIHPRQVAPIRRGLEPSAAEVAWARRMLSAEGAGAARVDGVMVDAPVLARARGILARLVPPSAEAISGGEPSGSTAAPETA